MPLSTTIHSTRSLYKGLLLGLLLNLFTASSNAQYVAFGNDNMRTEIGLNFGPTFFLGDLGGNRGYGTKFIKDVNLELTKMMKGAYITFYPSAAVGFRLAGQFTYVAGDDALITTKDWPALSRKQRNLNFRSRIWEAYGAVEFYPTLLKGIDNWDFKEPRIKPYGFFGIGIFHFNPEGSMTRNGVTTWHELQPLRTEGQGMAEYPDRKPYALTQLNIPMGCGVKIALSPSINTGIELLYRSTFTDYIDDVSTNYIDPQYYDKYLTPDQADIARRISDKAVGIVTPGLNRFRPGDQRGNPKNTDAYFSFLFKLGYSLNSGDHSGNPNRRARQSILCPRF